MKIARKENLLYYDALVYERQHKVLLQELYNEIMAHGYYSDEVAERVVPAEWVELVFKEAGLEV